jgi:DNA-binding transcriptional LysR family regulator
MQSRDEYINIPTQILRTVSVIAEAKSFTQAGIKLGLSQPAISDQMKRLQRLVGGAVFERNGSGGLSLTPKGKVVLTIAQTLLNANDRLLALGGIGKQSQRLRVGMTMLYAEQFLASLAQHSMLNRVQVTCAYSSTLAKMLEDGNLDIACLVDDQPAVGEPVFGWNEEFVWACGKDFELQLGQPIPIVGCEGALGSRMMNALAGAELLVTVAFDSADHGARVVATATGIGIMGMPARHVVDPLQLANRYSLPSMKPLRVCVVVRPDIEVDRISRVLDVLKTLAPPERENNGDNGQAAKPLHPSRNTQRSRRSAS